MQPCTRIAAVRKACSHAQGLQPCTRPAAMHKACSRAWWLQPCTVIAEVHKDCSYASVLQPCEVIAAIPADRSSVRGLQRCMVTAAMHEDRRSADLLEAAGPHQSRRSSKAALTHAGIKQRAASPRSRTPHHAAGLWSSQHPLCRSGKDANWHLCRLLQSVSGNLVIVPQGFYCSNFAWF